MAASRRTYLRRILRGLAILVALVVLLPPGLVGGLLLWLKLSPPPTSGEVALPGLSAPVDLAWDKDSIPHIFAGSLRDAYRVLGWVHARDRLWQMETQRRVGQGRLAELVGQAGVPIDREMRVLGFYRLAQTDYAALDAGTRADLDAYAAGVNAYLDHPAAPLPLEFQLLHATPERWTGADSLVWAKLMSLQLSDNYRTEAERASLVDQITPSAFRDLFPDSPEAGPSTLAALGGVDWRRFALALPPPLGPSSASNEWVVDGTLTKSGKPLLANDPHLGLGAPILWYLARIVTPEASVAGVTVPGVPFHILGHNDRVAWGLTTTGGDVQDLFIEDVDPASLDRYRTPDGEAAFTVRDELIKVRFGQDVHLTARESRHGPILSDIDPELAAIAGKDKAIALSFIGLDPGDTGAEALRGMNRARNWPDFQAALKFWRTPEQNLAYADADGHIAFTAVGVLPVRKRAPDDFPASGAAGDADWVGRTDFAQLPQAVDPPSHRFVNANNRIVPPDYPVFIAHRYGAPFRAERILAMLDGQTALTADDFARMQVDVKEEDAVLLLPRLLAAKPTTPNERRALTLLRAWDGTMDRDRPEPLIYTAWVFRLQAALIRSAAGDAAKPDRFIWNPEMIVRLLDRAGPAATDMLTATLGDTLDGLAKAYGADLAAWRWGAAHPAALKPQFLGSLPLVGDLFDIGLPAPGGAETVDRAGMRPSDGPQFPAVHGPGYRGVYDLADLDRSRMIIATGESGDPLSRHFGDLVQRWRDGGSVTLAGSLDEVAQSGIGRQRFVPSAP